MIEETRTNYVCEYCRRRYVMQNAAEWHEKHCTKNPTNNHLCYQGCRHYRAEKEDDGTTTYRCKKKGLTMYGCGAERRSHRDVIANADIRMPTECESYTLMSIPVEALNGIANGGLGDFDV